MNAPYIYDGLEAELYDVLDELAKFDDEYFYRWFIDANPGPVLDLGCGTGRVYLPLLKDGYEVVGVDSSQVMLDCCVQKAAAMGLKPNLRKGDMRSLSLGSKFETIIIPGFSIQMLLSDEDLRACLQRCVAHLVPGGQVIIPVYRPLEMLEQETDESDWIERARLLEAESNVEIVAYQAWRLDRSSQIMYLNNRYVELSSDREPKVLEEKEMAMRWYDQDSMVSEMQAIGLAEIQIYGDFLFESPLVDSEVVVFVGSLS